MSSSNSSNVEDEFQTPLRSESDQPTPQQSALNQRAMGNAYNGQSQVGQRDIPTNAEYNNLRQRLEPSNFSSVRAWEDKVEEFMNSYGIYKGDSDTSKDYTKQFFLDQFSLEDEMFFSKQVKGFRVGRQIIEDGQTLISPKITKQEKLKIAERNATKANRRSPRLNKPTPTEQRNLDREQRVINRQQKKDKSTNRKNEKAAKANNIITYPSVTLKSEKLNIVATKIKELKQKPLILRELPPGIGQQPFGRQGQANYVPTTIYTRTSEDNYLQNYPSRAIVSEDERKHNPVQQIINQEDFEEKVQDMKYFISDLGATGDELMDKFGGFCEYLSSVYDLVLSGSQVSDIVETSLQDLYSNIPTGLLDDINERSGRIEEVLDEDAVLNTLGNIDEALQTEILSTMRETLSNESKYRDENELDIPDQGGLPLSSSTGTNTEGLYENYGDTYYPENDGYRYNQYHGSGGGGGGSGGGGGIGDFGGSAFKAMQKLHTMSPHLAQLMSDQSTRPIYVKRMNIKSIYPPPPKNTNLEIVQQAIARSEEEASILNVYFN